MFRFQAASLMPGPSFHGDATARLAHPVGRTRAMMGLKGGKRPVRVGHHVDAPLWGYQYGNIRRVGGFGGSFGCFQDRLRVVEKCSHDELIGTGTPVF